MAYLLFSRPVTATLEAKLKSARTPAPRRLVGATLVMTVIAASVPALGALALPLPAAARPAARLTSAQTAAMLAARSKQEAEVARTVIVKVRPGVTPTAALEPTSAPVEVVPLGGDTYSITLPPGSDASSTAAALSRDPRVAIASRDTTLQLAAVPVSPDDPLWDTGDPLGAGQEAYLGLRTTSWPWATQFSSAWQQALGSGIDRLPPGRMGTRVAVVDTGYVFQAPTFDSTTSIVPGYDFADGRSDPTDHGTPEYSGGPTVSHGTWVANVIRAQSDNGWEAAGALRTVPTQIVVYKVFSDAGVGELSAIIAAIRTAADRGCRVINISAGVSQDQILDAEIAQLQDAVNYATGKGSLVVCAAGNYDPPSLPSSDLRTHVWYPAACTGALAVAALDPTAVSNPRSDFSCFGPQVGVSAPGQYIAAGGLDGTVDYVDGTSFSAPIVSAEAAMLFTLMPAPVSTGPQRVRDAIVHTAMHLGSGTPNIYYGYGLADAYSGWEGVINATSPQPKPTTFHATTAAGRTVNLSWSAVAGTNVVYRYGLSGGEQRITSATSAQIVVPQDGTYTVFVEPASDDHRGTQATTLSVDAANGTAPLPTTRAEGADRYATAAAVSRSTFPTGSASLVVASGENWPDALAAAPLARKVGAPLLLTHATALPYVTRDEIRRLFGGAGSVTVYIVGGTGAVSDVVGEQIVTAAAGHTVNLRRLAGADRYETAAEVAVELASSETTAVIASGDTWPDALCAGPLAAAADWPILLVHATGAPPAATTGAVAGMHHALVVGGSGAVSEATVDALLTSMAPSSDSTRIAGVDRQDTSRRVADWGASAGILTGSALDVATGASFPDGLTAGPAGAQRDCPVLLVSDASTQLPSLLAWATARSSSTGSLGVFGGTAAVSLALQHDLQRALRP